MEVAARPRLLFQMRLRHARHDPPLPGVRYTFTKVESHLHLTSDYRGLHSQPTVPATWTVWLGCEGRAPEGQLAPSSASPFTSYTLSSLPPPHLHFRGVAGGYSTHASAHLKAPAKNAYNPTESAHRLDVSNSLSRPSPPSKNLVLQYTRLYTYRFGPFGRIFDRKDTEQAS